MLIIENGNTLNLFKYDGHMHKKIKPLMHHYAAVLSMISSWRSRVKMSAQLRVLRHCKPQDEIVLQQTYQESECAGRPDTFVLYRIIGNDLDRRHKTGQSIGNLQFILENEPELAGCEKRWIVNRIIDFIEEAAIIDMLDRHGKPYIHIPFKPDEYREIGFDTTCFPAPDYFSSEQFSELAEPGQQRAVTMSYRLKNNYVMNSNGARNAALRDGRKRAKWVLPWDGNCFLTHQAWSQICKAIHARPYLPYFVVPMARVTENAKLVKRHYAPAPFDEPQVFFRADTDIEFDERYSYGRRPKVELFWRLGVPGPWDKWTDDPWDVPRSPHLLQAGQFGTAGWVARLFSGIEQLELPNKQSRKSRGSLRQEAIIGTLDMLDCLVIPSAQRSDPVTAYCASNAKWASDCTLDDQNPRQSALTSALLRDAEAACDRGPYSIIDRTTLPLSGNLHDYWSPAPYWWPNTETRNGLPYVLHDGKRVPGTRLDIPGNERHDRTRLQSLFDDTAILSLGWTVSGNRKYAAHAAHLIRTWFINPETKMNPHLTYAQVITGKNNNQGRGRGIIEFKDIYFFLDAVRLLEPSGELTESDLIVFRKWLWRYLMWLKESPQGQRERMSLNNHGTYYDLQAGAIAAYLGDTKTLDDILRQTVLRVREQFSVEGIQHHEITRTLSQHYCCFNFQAWIHLASLARTRGINLWRQEASGGSLLTGAGWLLSHAEGTWPYQQIDDFDTDRFMPIMRAAIEAGFEHDVLKFSMEFKAVKPRFFSGAGIAPYWNLM